MKKRAKRVERKFTPAEKARWEKKRDLAEQDKTELMNQGRRFKEASERVSSHIIEALKEAKEVEGLSLADLAERSGIDRPSISKLLNNHGNPTLRTLHRIAAALGCDLQINLVKSK